VCAKKRVAVCDAVCDAVCAAVCVAGSVAACVAVCVAASDIHVCESLCCTHTYMSATPCEC